MKAQHDIYRNLHTHTWSQVDRSTGLVASHPHEALILDASFVVQPAGNKKVRKDKKKHVHAFVRGHEQDRETGLLELYLSKIGQREGNIWWADCWRYFIDVAGGAAGV